MQLLKMQHVMASTGCFAMNEFLPTECVKAKLYPLIAPLGETLLPLQDIQAGVMSVSAGLLSGKYFKIMGKYLPSIEKQRRATKEDLSGLTAEEKLGRRKTRARMYNRLSCNRRKRLHDELRTDVNRMGIYKNIIDDAPDMMCVISSDIQSQVLYVNKAARCVLPTEPTQLVGSSFWNIVHKDDKMAVLTALSAVTTLKSAGKVEKVRCGVVTKYPGVYMSVRMTLANGVQGIVCIMCHKDPLVSPDGRPCVM
ncbi:pas pac sensor hybrid histidine kinase [Nannochloropsis oceanica]